jgi:hypothetical protein
MRPTTRHILELVLLLGACRLGGVDLHADSGHRKAQQDIVAMIDVLPSR